MNRLHASDAAPLPDLCAFVIRVGHAYQCGQLVLIGSDCEQLLSQLTPHFDVVTVTADDSLSAELLSRSILLCCGLPARRESAESVIALIATFLDASPICILSIPSSYWVDDLSSVDPLSADPWPGERPLAELLQSNGLVLEFCGATIDNDQNFEKRDMVAVVNKLPGTVTSASGSTKTHFRVVAIIPVYNEEDILVPSIRYLIDQGIDVYLLENWSTDATYDLAQQFLGQGLLGIERFPKDGPSKYHDWKSMLQRIEQVSNEIDADWFLLQGCDEIHVSPWPDLSLKEAFVKVDGEGFNCIDHTVITFHPVDNGYSSGASFESYFRYFEFSAHPAHFTEMTAWKNAGPNVCLAESGGHQAQFDGRRVYPFKFLLKHYPIRSQSHGEQKVFRDRKPRWSPERRAAGWHNQYDHIQSGDSFLNTVEGLEFFDEAVFNRTHVIERLSGIGIVRQDWEGAIKSAGHRRAVLAQLEQKDRDARNLSAQVFEKDRIIQTQGETIALLSADLSEKQGQLDRIHRSLGWRFLKRYGSLKHPYLLPLYRVLRLEPQSDLGSPNPSGDDRP